MRILLASLAGLFGVGCTFDTSFTPADAPREGIDVLGVVPSCKALHNAMPTLPDTTYVIDPDGMGPEMQRMVSCDMSTSGGGWTIVFVADNTNLSTLSTYSFLSPKLMMDATEALISYRDPNMASTPNYATFALPAEWKAAAPFGYSGTDLVTMVSVNDETPVSATLRYGLDNFDTRCSDNWVGNTKLGRICVLGTRAPFFNGFYSSVIDHCSDSLGDWNTVACTAQLRFSIAVR